jgi:hypothetical protein
MENAGRLTFREAGVVLHTFYYPIGPRFAVHVYPSLDCRHLERDSDEAI